MCRNVIPIPTPSTPVVAIPAGWCLFSSLCLLCVAGGCEGGGMEVVVGVGVAAVVMLVLLLVDQHLW